MVGNVPNPAPRFTVDISDDKLSTSLDAIEGTCKNNTKRVTLLE